jgi:hypothetical protein
MFSFIQLLTASLDRGVPMSQLDTILILLLLSALPMIPYAFFYISLRRQERANEVGAISPVPKESLGTRMFGWLHWRHHHPVVHP